jgi:hypothetical protein
MSAEMDKTGKFQLRFTASRAGDETRHGPPPLNGKHRHQSEDCLKIVTGSRL